MHKLAFRAMGCQMLAVIDRDDAQAEAQLAEAPTWFAAWEQQLSRFRADSDLSRLNTAGGKPVVVPPALVNVLAVALDAAQQSNGLVCPTVLDALEAAGYDRSFADLPPERPATAPPVEPTDWRTIEVDKVANTITLPVGARLDLGGVAKGWAADQAAQRLAAIGPALVDAGGDIAVSGPMADGASWPIAVANPLAPGTALGLLRITYGAVATSGRDYRHWQRGGSAQHHIIDPRTGRSAKTDVLTATIVASDGPTAEMAAKVALMLGSHAGLTWLNARPTLAGLLVLADGRVLRSRWMDLYLDEPDLFASAAALSGAV